MFEQHHLQVQVVRKLHKLMFTCSLVLYHKNTSFVSNLNPQKVS